MISNTEKRFWEKVGPITDEGCWSWIGSKTKNNRGTFWLNGRMVTAPRASLELFFGITLDNNFACHHCDNENCVNPSHIFVGDNKQNLIDASNKGRLHHQQKTHCINGHPLSGENIRKRRIGNGRVCKLCMKTYRSVYKLRRRVGKEE